MIEKPPVFFMHGLLVSADWWIVNQADNAPAFIAARAGYDVWLGNHRGNTYSRLHTRLNPDDDKDKEEYWNFSFHEMGIYDNPAVLDFISEKTNGQKVAYIGHSQGTAQFYVGSSLLPDYYEEKVPLFISLGTVTKVSHTESKLIQGLSSWYD